MDYTKFRRDWFEQRNIDKILLNWMKCICDLSNIITSCRYLYNLRSWYCIIRYVDGDTCTRLFNISQIQKYRFILVLCFSLGLKAEQCLCLLSSNRTNKKIRIRIITLTSNLCSTLSPAKTLLAVAFILMYPNSLGIIMNDTLEPEFAFTSTFFLRYNSNSEKL